MRGDDFKFKPRLSHKVVKVQGPEYIQAYREVDKFIEYCKVCRRYQTSWSCPPFDFDADAYISGFDTVLIIGSQIFINKEIREENRSREKAVQIADQMIDKARLYLDKKLLEMEQRYFGSRAFFAGSCRICAADKCMRSQGKPCFDPDILRPSLEAFGFDISRTASELLNIDLQWAEDGKLPEYFTLVSGLFMPKRSFDENEILALIRKEE